MAAKKKAKSKARVTKLKKENKFPLMAVLYAIVAVLAFLIPFLKKNKK